MGVFGSSLHILSISLMHQMYERYLEYEWNRHEFGKNRKQSFSEFINTVEKRRQTRRSKFFTMFDRKIAEGRLLDVVQSPLGYIFTYYHTVDGNIYKKWMNEKQAKKDFCIHKNDDEKKSDSSTYGSSMYHGDGGRVRRVFRKLRERGKRIHHRHLPVRGARLP